MTLLFKAFYENNNLVKLSWQIPRYRDQLKKNAVPNRMPQYIGPSKTFMRLLEKLTKLRDKLQQDGLEAKELQRRKDSLIKAIHKAKSVDNATWLLSKINELKE